MAAPPVVLDDDYVVYHHRRDAAGGLLLVRRAQSLEQWTRARANAEYADAARALVRWMPPAAAWHALHRQTLPRCVTVAYHEPLVDAGAPLPFAGPPAHLVAVAAADRNIGAADRLLVALVRVDADALLAELQCADPLSWHCVSRAQQHAWFCNQPQPCHERAASPPPPPPLQRHLPAERPFVLDAEERLLTVEIDALDSAMPRRVARAVPLPSAAAVRLQSCLVERTPPRGRPPPPQRGRRRARTSRSRSPLPPGKRARHQYHRSVHRSHINPKPGSNRHAGR